MNYRFNIGKESIELYKVSLEAAIFHLSQEQIEDAIVSPSIQAGFDNSLEELGYGIRDNIVMAGFSILMKYGGDYVTQENFDTWKKETKASWTDQDIKVFEEFLVRRYKFEAWG